MCCRVEWRVHKPQHSHSGKPPLLVLMHKIKNIPECSTQFSRRMFSFSISMFLEKGSCYGFRLPNLLWGLLIFLLIFLSSNKERSLNTISLLTCSLKLRESKPCKRLLLQSHRGIVELKITLGRLLQHLVLFLSSHVLVLCADMCVTRCSWVGHWGQRGKMFPSFSVEAQHSQQIQCEMISTQKLVLEVPCCWMEIPRGTAWF